MLTGYKQIFVVFSFSIHIWEGPQQAVEQSASSGEAKDIKNGKSTVHVYVYVSHNTSWRARFSSCAAFPMDPPLLLKGKIQNVAEKCLLDNFLQVGDLILLKKDDKEP